MCTHTHTYTCVTPSQCDSEYVSFVVITVFCILCTETCVAYEADRINQGFYVEGVSCIYARVLPHVCFVRVAKCKWAYGATYTAPAACDTQVYVAVFDLTMLCFHTSRQMVGCACRSGRSPDLLILVLRLHPLLVVSIVACVVI